MTETYNLATPSLGVTAGYSATSGGSPTSVAQLKSVDLPSMEMGTWESTGLASAAKEFLPTIVDAGELTLHLIWLAAETTHAALFADFLAGTLLYWTVTFPAPIGPGAVSETTHTLKFASYMTGFELSPADVENYIEGAAKMKITGLPAIA